MTKPVSLGVLGLLLPASSCALLSAQDKPAAAPQAKTEAPAKGDAPAEAEVDPAPSVTAHTITVGGKTLKYHATAGYLVLKVEESKSPGRPDGDAPGDKG